MNRQMVGQVSKQSDRQTDIQGAKLVDRPMWKED